MLLAEDLLVLLVKKSTREPPRDFETKPVLAAAVLMELATANRIGVDWDGGDRLHLFVDDHTPLGDPELDGALAIVAGLDGECLWDVVVALVPDLHIRLVNRLVARGCLDTRWRVADQSRRDYLRTWLTGVLHGLVPIAWGSGALITLLNLANSISVLTNGPVPWKRVEAIAAGDWPAGTAAEAIATSFEKVVSYWGTHSAFGFRGSPP